MSRQSVDSGKMSVPSVATDRNGQTFMSRQARGITMIEYMSRQAGDHPRSGRRDNSFMPRRPYAGVAPAQPGPTPVASTSTSAGAASGCTICVWSRLRELANCQRAADKERILMASRHQILSPSPKYGQLPELDSEDIDNVLWIRPAATKAEVSGPTRPPYARRLASRISPRSGSRSNSIILRLPYKGSVRLNKEHEAFVFLV